VALAPTEQERGRMRQFLARRAKRAELVARVIRALVQGELPETSDLEAIGGRPPLDSIVAATNASERDATGAPNR
jgi:hypothetical protein